MLGAAGAISLRRSSKVLLESHGLMSPSAKV